MKTRILFAVAIFAALSTGSSAAEVVARTTIRDISLFRDGALVTRQGNITLPAGKSTIRFNQLPTQVDPTSLQVALINQTDGLIRNAKIYVPETPEENSTVQELQDTLDAVKEEKGLMLRARAEALADINFANSMRNSFSKEFGKINEGESLTLDQARELAKFVAQTQDAAYARIDAVDQDLKGIDERIKTIEKDLKEATRTALLLSSIAEIDVEMAEAGETEIALSYLVNSARWVPQYELRARPDEKVLDFGYFASVWQNTGEDWENVSLSLHTNQASRLGNVPVLHPLSLHKQEDFHAKAIPGRAKAALMSPVVPQEAADSFGRNEIVQVTASTVSFQAVIPGKVTVPSSSNSSSFKVLEASFEAEFWSEVVPGIQLDTYLRARIRNSLELPILPGQALAFVDGKLSSKVHLDKILPDEETELSLGTDGNIIVKRRDGTQKDSSSGFIDKTRTLHREYQNKVTNLHTVAHKVIIVDQFPIAQNSKIEIRRKSPDESDVTIKDENKHNGVFQWEARLAPKESKTFTTSFDIIYPRDWTLYPRL